jgi:small subunit ribosomal protein S5
MVVVGNGRGKVGWGYGKANEVPPSVEKAVKDGSRSMIEISLDEGTIPHQVEGRYGAARVVLVPAAPGTGVIAGNAVRAVCEAAGITNILTKSFGSNNPTNLVKATMNALRHLRTRHEVERLRVVTLTLTSTTPIAAFTSTKKEGASAAAPAAVAAKPPAAVTKARDNWPAGPRRPRSKAGPLL